MTTFKGIDGVTQVDDELKSFGQLQAMLSEMTTSDFQNVRDDILTPQHVWSLTESQTVQFYIGTLEGEGVLYRAMGKHVLAAVLVEEVTRQDALKATMRGLATNPQAVSLLDRTTLFGYGYALGEMEDLLRPGDEFMVALHNVRTEIMRRGLLDDFAKDVATMQTRIWS